MLSKAEEKARLLESANSGLLLRVNELEESLVQVGESEALQKEEIERLQAALLRAEENEVFLKADFEFQKDDNANFAYYMAFADAIRAHHHSDLIGYILAMIKEFTAYFRDNPSDPSLLIERFGQAGSRPVLLLQPGIARFPRGSVFGKAIGSVGDETEVVPLGDGAMTSMIR